MKIRLGTAFVAFAFTTSAFVVTGCSFVDELFGCEDCEDAPLCEPGCVEGPCIEPEFTAQLIPRPSGNPLDVVDAARINCEPGELDSNGRATGYNCFDDTRIRIGFSDYVYDDTNVLVRINNYPTSSGAIDTFVLLTWEDELLVQADVRLRDVDESRLWLLNFSFDDDGRLDSFSRLGTVEFYDGEESTEEEYTQQTSYSYGPFGTRRREVADEWSSRSTTWRDDGRVRLTTLDEDNWLSHTRVEWSYDDDGRLQERAFFNDDEPWKVETFVYNSDGDLVEFSTFGSGPLEVFRVSDLCCESPCPAAGV